MKKNFFSLEYRLIHFCQAQFQLASSVPGELILALCLIINVPTRPPNHPPPPNPKKVQIQLEIDLTIYGHGQ